MPNPNENNGYEKCHMLISLSPQLRQRYKSWCVENGISMNTGLVSFMQTVTAKKKRYKVQQRILELAK